jgi:hypothetical protein
VPTGCCPRRYPGNRLMAAQRGRKAAPSRYLGGSDAAILVRDPRREGRRKRSQVRNGLRKVTANKALAHCGLYPSPLHGGWVHVHHGEGGATFSGVKTCGLIWLCPVCSATMRQGRAREIELGVGVWLAMRGGVAFGTFTLPHRSRTPLRASLDALRDAYRDARQDYSVRAVLSELGVEGTIRALEVTHGLNGWHPHLHLLWLTRGPLTADECSRLQAAFYRAFTASLERRGWAAPSKRHGVLVLPVSLVRGAESIGTYLSKVQDAYGDSTVAKEMSRSDLKTGRKKSRTPFELAESAGNGNRADAARWLEYEAGIKGARAIEWSRHLKGRLGVLEVDDVELLEQENQRGPMVAALSPQDFRMCVRYGDEWLLLDLAEDGGATAVYAEVERRRAVVA